MLSHIILHVALCKSAANLPAKTPLSVHVVVAYRIRKPEMDAVLPLDRETSGYPTAEFDAPQGLYELFVSVPKRTGCSSAQFFTVLPDHDRDVSVDLNDPVARPMVPSMVAGSSPQHVHAAVALFAKGVKCDGPVGTPVNDPIDNLSGPDAYYSSMYSSAGSIDSTSRVVALRLTDSSGGYHYVRIPASFPPIGSRWPAYVHMNVGTDVIDYAATKPEDTLLCPPLLKTSAG